MTYPEALEILARGGKAKRSWWCACWISRRNGRLVFQHDDLKRENFRPTADDRDAADWEEML